ncbi:hypothetical protein SAMN05443667_10328 [Flavobacterium gillisiae]|uniref:O-Antigen ligase n=1 Tax=Flavobacterium gillisiae TaxID=150146 RepID=A0A1H3ZRX3_9FLAO|nr:hypothetical protein [Flavobacterium gillisiae]SEA26022.1 hypothetical protein SAMN05443667_10328 [Flavobacterium gillisiae]
MRLFEEIKNAKVGILNRADWCFFFIVFVMRYISYAWWGFFLNFISAFKIGAALTAFLLSFLFYLINVDSIRKYKKSFVIRAIVLCSFFIFCNSIRSYLLYEDIEELMTVLKYNYIQALTFVLMLPYLMNLKVEKIYSFIKILYFFTLFQIVIYVIQFTGLAFLDSRGFNSGGIDLVRSYGAFPDFNILVPFVLIGALTGNRKFFLLIGLYLMCVVLSLGRGQILSFGLLLAISLILFSIKFLNIGILFKSMMMIISVFGLLLVAFPKTISVWDNMFSSTVNNELKKGQGTYAVRTRIIDKAENVLTINDAELFGLGYKRDFNKNLKLSGTKGVQSIVFTQDTSIAGVLYCEGYIGFMIRLLPIVVLFLWAVNKLIRRKRSVLSVFLIAIIAIIISESANIVQSTIFTRYMTTFFDVFLIYRVYTILYARITKDKFVKILPNTIK